MPFVYFSLVSCKKGHLYTLSIPFFSVGIDRLANKGTKVGSLPPLFGGGSVGAYFLLPS